MGRLECCRIILYIVEWIWTTVVMAIFPNKLAVEAPTVNGAFENICLFNANVGRSRCQYGVAWATVAFVVLSITMIWYFLDYCSNIQLPANVEFIIFSWLALWWFVGSVTLTATKSSRAPSPSNVPVVFAWMLFILSMISAYIGSRGPKTFEYRMSETEPEPEGSYRSYGEGSSYQQA
ncbi:unnamed protein product [Agarophyton chilense]